MLFLKKRAAPTENRTQAKGFKVLCANRYTIGAPAAFYALQFIFNLLRACIGRNDKNNKDGRQTDLRHGWLQLRADTVILE